MTGVPLVTGSTAISYVACATFASSAATVTAGVSGDTDFEPDEGFTVTLSSNGHTFEVEENETILDAAIRQHVGLPEPTMGREDANREDHGHAAQECLEGLGRGRLQDVEQQGSSGFADIIGGLVDRGQGRVNLLRQRDVITARHRELIRDLDAEAIGNKLAQAVSEALTLIPAYQTSDLDTAMDAVAQDVEAAAVTLSEEGAVVVRGGQRTRVPANASKVVDTTGAGDNFDAGFSRRVMGQVCNLPEGRDIRE